MERDVSKLTFKASKTEDLQTIKHFLNDVINVINHSVVNPIFNRLTALVMITDYLLKIGLAQM